MQGRENLNNPLKRLDLKYNPVCLDDGTLKNWYERIVVFDKGEHVLFPFFLKFLPSFFLWVWYLMPLHFNVSMNWLAIYLNVVINNYWQLAGITSYLRLFSNAARFIMAT